MAEGRTLYEAIGGEAPFHALVEAFYRGVEQDPELRPMYPPDLEESRAHLALFLIQYFGGPQTYMETRGHPRLRMRHMPFVIGRAERDAWFRHMSAAVDEVGIEEPYREHMLRYFSDAATFLINRQPA
ncbi:MAG: globin [Dehalococcoidia bacterium]